MRVCLVVCYSGSGFHSGDADARDKEVLRGLEDEGLSCKVGRSQDIVMSHTWSHSLQALVTCSSHTG